MFSHILVPLDGSALAESALPVAIYAARMFQAGLTLFHVIEKDAPDEIHGERHLGTVEEATLYLEKIAAGVPSDIAVQRHVHSEETENVAKSIVEHSGELGDDLIVMCSHGHGRLKNLLVGSIASKVIGWGTVPVILIQPDPNTPPRFEGFSTILVALDNASIHDESLEVASMFAKRLHAEMVLLTVVPTQGTLQGNHGTSGMFLPGTAQTLLEMEEAEIRAHLETHASELFGKAVHARVVVNRGDPAREIAKAAQKQDRCILVLGTHGKAGMNAFWAGSMASRVVASTKIPILLIPLRQAG